MQHCCSVQNHHSVQPCCSVQDCCSVQNCNSVLCAGLLLLQLLELAAEISVGCTGVTLGKLSGC